MSTARLQLDLPDGRRETVLAADDDGELPLSAVLARRGFPLNTRCGGRGLCRGCEVEPRGGELRALANDAAAGVASGAGVRACQVRLGGDGDVALAVPARSLLKHAPAVVTDFFSNVPWAHDPLGPPARYGAAVDVGTTTVVLLLCELASGRVLAEASAFNAQIRFGEDVLTRIQFCATGADAVAQLQRAVAAETLQPLLEQACARAEVAPGEVGVMTVAANTTMQHLLAGADPSPLGIYPFRPVFLDHRIHAPAELGLAFGGSGAEVHLLPSPAPYVGADLAAGMVVTGLLYDEGPVLLVDIGTNGEIVAKVGNRLVGCATAAGPAFEGAGLSSGMRGVRGAIERVRLGRDPFEVTVGVIGDEPRPIGICGSGYVDFLGEGRRAGVLQANGRFADDLAVRAGGRVTPDDYGRRLCVHAHGAAGPIWISEMDVVRLLQAKAAIAAGIVTLLDVLGTKAADVKTLYLAGGFGMHLSIEQAIGCGLLPGFTPGQITVVGNASLGGAFLALNDRSLLAEMKAACATMAFVELNLQAGFEDAYIDHLALP